MIPPADHDDIPEVDLVLGGQRVVLAPLSSADCELLYGWIRDRATMVLSSPYHPVGSAEHRVWFETIQQRDDVSIFGIRLAASDELIGSCQLTSADHVHRNAEMQVRIGPPERRQQGFGTEAIELLLRFAFDDLNLHRVHLHTFGTNTAAIRVYERLGFVIEGTLRDAAYINGQYVDLVVMGMLASECPAMRRGSPPPSVGR